MGIVQIVECFLMGMVGGWLVSWIEQYRRQQRLKAIDARLFQVKEMSKELDRLYNRTAKIIPFGKADVTKN